MTFSNRMLTELNYLSCHWQPIDHDIVSRRCHVCVRSKCEQIHNLMCSILWSSGHQTPKQCIFHRNQRHSRQLDGQPKLVAVWFHSVMSCPRRQSNDPVAENGKDLSENNVFSNGKKKLKKRRRKISCWKQVVSGWRNVHEHYHSSYY